MRVVLLGLLLATAWCDDSLKGALEAIQRRQRDLASPVFFSRPYVLGDGQPEDIGYGYQKSVAPNTAGVFEPLALPAAELGNHDFEERPDVKTLEKLMLDYLEEGENEIPREYQRYVTSPKRSIFREREETDLPDALQRLYDSEDIGKPEDTPVFIPSSFRERFTDNRKARLQNAHALVRNFGGLNRGFGDNYAEEPDENEEYLNILNSIWEKYKSEQDPEEITESDVEELLEYLSAKEEKKRQYGSSYDMGYDFFNSPLSWTKRMPKKELYRQDGGDIGRVVMGTPRFEEMRGHHKKNVLQDVAFDDRYPYRGMQKRFPITKRSPHSSPMYRSVEGQRRKKNSNSIKQETDPKVAEELNSIFSSEQKSTTANSSGSKNDTVTTKSPIEVKNTTVQSTGQKESSSENAMTKPLEVKKKSINWSDYFGIDKRKKKSMSNDINDEWLLNQYLNAYGIAKQEDSDNSLDPIMYDKPKKRSDDMDAKLRAMEDLIVDQAIKYTGAHEGTTDSKEVQEVKDKVMAQLAAAYSLEKMRRALGEFKTSIAAQKASAPASHSIPSPKIEKQDAKFKRIAVKKEKVDLSNEEKAAKKDNQEISNAIKPEMDRYLEKEENNECPILQDIQMRCRQISIISGDRGEVFLPLCTLHQICYLCGPEVGYGGVGSARACDSSFLSEAHAVCREDPACYYTARRTLAALRGVKSDLTCDWRTHPCLAQFLAVATRR